MMVIGSLFQYGFDILETQKQLNGTVALPDDVDTNGIKLTTTITLNSHAVSDRAEIPIPDITPGTYTENKQLEFNIKQDWSKVSEIRYTTDGSEPSETSGTVYSSGTPIELNGTAGESKTITVKVMAVGNGCSNSEVQAYKYTIDLPAEKETVTVTNGIGSGEYNNGDAISIIAQPKSGKAFKNWIAEAVTYTTTEGEVTETIHDENGDEKEITTTKTTRSARTIDGCFADASKSVTTFTVPEVESGAIIEITAQCADAITAVNLKADIPSYGGDMPSEMTASTDGVTVSDFAVTPNDAVAEENTQYTMAVKVRANEGYAFGETPIFTVNGTTAAGNPNTDGTYTVVYTFKTGIREVFSGMDATGTKSEYHDSNKGDWADSYYAEINISEFSIPTALKWTVTNDESRTADVPFEVPEVSGKGFVRFGFIITGTEDELSKVNKVELNVQ
ncbi:MAG: chitobiase/beta-hexosaminidase C-terminal domain-containing protein [Clostridiales bacterium]|nr:chitobiase/beta-hexosaminidase C-terminal domain-containing protein [Clostridiales bacterium]